MKYLSLNCISYFKSTIAVKQYIKSDGNSLYRKCRHKDTNTLYAVKIVTRRIDCNREVMILKQCQGHPNIVILIDVFTDEVMFECNTILQAILEYCKFINIKWIPIYVVVMVTIEQQSLVYTVVQIKNRNY
jgi:serine/threonine protein kinase